MTIVIRKFLPIAAMLLSTAVHAQLYKHVGPDGKISYSDVPPAANAAGKTQTVDTGEGVKATPPRIRKGIWSYTGTSESSANPSKPDDGTSCIDPVKSWPFWPEGHKEASCKYGPVMKKGKTYTLVAECGIMTPGRDEYILTLHAEDEFTFKEVVTGSANITRTIKVDPSVKTIFQRI